MAEQADSLQYELREGPCYAAVNGERFVLVNDLSAAVQFPRYAPKAVGLGVGAQAAVQLLDGKRRAGLNLYARQREPSTVPPCSWPNSSPPREQPCSGTPNRSSN